MKRLAIRVCLAVLALGCALPAQDRASVNGTITDASGARISGASVDLKSAATGLHRTTRSNASGLYEITPLPVGVYSISISHPGFRPVTVENLELLYGETRTFDARLEVGANTESIQVAATAEALNRTNAEV